jgi:hypothetical protein
MNPIIVSARYAAFVWFQGQPENAGKGHDEAHAFARAHWEQFLPLANEGWGRLLLKIARKHRKRSRARAAVPGGATLSRSRPVETPREPAVFAGYTWTGDDR